MTTSVLHRAIVFGGVALIACLLAPAAATAAAARVVTKDLAVRGDPVGSEVLSRLVFEARSGERNRIRVRVHAGAFTVTDRVPITAGRGCTPRGRRAVRCAIVEAASALSARLGDRSDSLTVIGPLTDSQEGGGGGFAEVRGGSGHDTIALGRRSRGAPFGALLVGGPGNDRLDSPSTGNSFVGGPGDDIMIGGRGPDYFDEGARRNGSDTMLGGKQFSLLADEVSYGKRRGRVRADLDGRRDDGAPGERDRIGRDIERLRGGAGADHLSGDARRNELFGGGGADELSGGGADDTVAGNAGPDRLAGGAGNDRLEGGGNDPDTLTGGPGNDELTARGDSVKGGPGFDVVSSLGDAGNTIDLRGGGRDHFLCLGTARERLRLDALDFFAAGLGSGLGGACDRVEVDREGEALALFRGAPEVSHFVGRPVALVDFGCPGDAAASCSARVRIEMGGRAYDPVEYSGQVSTNEVLNVPIDPAAVRRLDRLEVLPAFLLVSARTASGGTVERRHPIRLGATSSAGFR